jgi:hypothetical protein
VLDSPQGKFVYVPGKSQDGRDVALPRPVTVGDWVEFDGQNQWIVESGLKPGVDRRRHREDLSSPRWLTDHARPAAGRRRTGRAA